MPGAELSDNQLAALAGRGDADAYRRLFERYQNPVYNFVYRLVNNAEDASDVVQNAFLRMYTVLGEKDVQNFSAYLYRTARNLAYDEMRRRSRFADVDEELLAPEDPNIYADPQRALQLGEQIGTVRRAADKLNENQRAALIMRELQDMDYDQMSEVLDSNRNAVGAMLSRARLRFREELRMAQVATDKAPPECERIIALLSPYIDNELDDAGRAEVDEHLRDCTFCTAALEEMREASRSFRMLIPVVPPPDLAEAFEGGLQQLAGQGAPAPGTDEGAMWDQDGYPEVHDGSTVAVSDQPAGKASLFLRMMHSRALWIGLLSVTAISLSVFALAESTGRENLLQDEQAIEEELFDENTNDEDLIVPEEPLDTQEPVPADGDDTPPQTDPDPGSEPQPQAPLGIGGTSINPNPVREDGQFTLTVTVYGSARSVTANIKGLNDVKLTRISSGGDSEVWSGTATAAGGGYFEVYINATGANGQSANEYGGTLEVIYLY